MGDEGENSWMKCTIDGDALLRDLDELAQIGGNAAGNSIGRLPGSEDLAPIALGSHTDTVPNGGRYDGALGVLAALACVRAIRQEGLELRHPLEVINFQCEEAAIGPGT